MLRYGSVGEAVRRLQLALNLDLDGPGFLGEKLTPDGQFGSKTHRRVQQFQSTKGTTPDGLVGPVTLGFLKPLFDLLDKLGPPGPPGDPPGALALRARIAAEALGLEAAWGWSNPAALPPKGAPNIALRRLEDAATRARHGGRSLQIIFHGAGALAGHVARCPTIAPGMAVGECSEAEYSEQRNEKDVPSWCGIFALYVLRRSGILLRGWGDALALTAQVADPKKPETAGNPLRRVSQAEVGVGDIGVLSPTLARNHHFIVVERDGPTLRTVDGNAGLFHSIVRTQYTLLNATSTNSVEDRMVHGHRGPESCALLSAIPQGIPPGFQPI